MKIQTTLLAVSYVNAACECMGYENRQTDQFFDNWMGKPDYGLSCSMWDADMAWCLEGDENYAPEDYCYYPWCFVKADNDC